MALRLKKYAEIMPHASKKALVMVKLGLQRLDYSQDDGNKNLSVDL
jgi:hypothetical protein